MALLPPCAASHRTPNIKKFSHCSEADTPSIPKGKGGTTVRDSSLGTLGGFFGVAGCGCEAGCAVLCNGPKASIMAKSDGCTGLGPQPASKD